MRKLIFILIILISVNSWNQNSDVQKFDRAKWKELKGKLKYKRGPNEQLDRSNGDRSSEGWWEEGQEGRNEGDKSYRDRKGSSSSRPESSSRDSSFDVNGGLSGVAKVILIILAAVLLAFILFQIFFKDKNNEFQNAEIKEDPEEFDINTIQKSDLEIALEKALAEKDYRKCVRIYFAFILKELSTNRLILWERDKTNFEYLSELKDKKEFHGFRNSVEIFEIIWYGERAIDEDIYHKIEPDFKNYLNQITKE